MFSKSTRYCVGQHLSPCGVIFYCVGVSHFASLLFVCCAFLSAFWLLRKMLLSTFVHTCYMLIFLLDSSSGVESLLSSGNSTFHYVRNARFPSGCAIPISEQEDFNISVSCQHLAYYGFDLCFPNEITFNIFSVVFIGCVCIFFGGGSCKSLVHFKMGFCLFIVVLHSFLYILDSNPLPDVQCFLLL